MNDKPTPLQPDLPNGPTGVDAISFSTDCDGGSTTDSAATDSAATDAPISPSLRDELHNSLDRWLDQLNDDAAEDLELPDEIWALLESEPNHEVMVRSSLASLWSNMTVLSQEIKLQSRSFERLGQQIKEQYESLSTEPRSTSLSPSARDSTTADSSQKDRRFLELAEGLFDAREWLRRVAKAAQDQLQLHQESSHPVTPPRPETVVKKRFFVDLFRRKRQAPPETRQTKTTDPSNKTNDPLVTPIDMVQSIIDGASLASERLTQALQKHHITELAALGRPFDPNKMTAVHVTHDSCYPDGTVTELLQAGYQCDGEILRTCEVSVNRIL